MAKLDRPNFRFVQTVGISPIRKPARAAFTGSSTDRSKEVATVGIDSTTERRYALKALETSWIFGPPARRTSTEYRWERRCFGELPTMPPPRMYRDPATTSHP